MKNIIIVDIDGTIAKMGDRIKYLQQEPKDWDKFYNDCFDDEPISDIIALVHTLYYSGNPIVFCTGRRDSCRHKTIQWFSKYFTKSLVGDCKLLMRPDNDHRSDTLVKPELLVFNNIHFDDILLVLEDRDKMVKKWRDLGLTCLQVKEGNY